MGWKYFRVKADHLVVTSSVAALAYHTLGYAVQACELHVVEFAVLVLVALLQVPQAFLEAVEFALKDIGLVDFVRKHDKLLFGTELED